MSHTLAITDGTTTVTFTSGNLYLAQYSPAVAVDLEHPVKEKVKIGLTNSISTIQGNINSINRLFYQAAQWHRNRTGPKVYVNFDPNASGTPYRSLLYSGACHLDDEFLGGMWGAQNLECELEWERDPFWEGALTQIPLTNGHATNDTSGIQVDNTNDSSRDNWVTIAAADVIGDLPAPIKLRMVNGAGGGIDGDDIWVFHNVHSTPASFAHILEAESSTSTVYVASTSSSTTASAGGYATFSWGSATETKFAEWILSSTQMSYAAGGRFAILARFYGVVPVSNLWVRAKLETTTSGKYPMFTGSLTKMSNSTAGRELVLLDTVRLAPYLEGSTSIREIALSLYGLRASTTNSVILDYLQLSPISGDGGWLHFLSVASGVPDNAAFVHDATEGMTYRTVTDAEQVAEFTQYGGPILLVPNAAQKLYFLTSNFNGIADITQTWTVKLWYRPRRVII